MWCVARVVRRSAAGMPGGIEVGHKTILAVLLLRFLSLSVFG